MATKVLSAPQVLTKNIKTDREIVCLFFEDFSIGRLKCNGEIDMNDTWRVIF